MTACIAFTIRPHPDGNGVVEVVPVVDGVEFSDRIHEFERDAGMETRAISYGGLVPAYFRFGTASDHFLAAEGAFVDGDGRVPLLGCECGEWGCWPLVARIVAEESTVTWTAFEQPHRKDRDYSGFGPFVFDREAYETAVEGIAATWEAESNP